MGFTPELRWGRGDHQNDTVGSKLEQGGERKSDVEDALFTLALFEHCARRADREGIFALVVRSWMLDTPAREIAWERWVNLTRRSGKPPPDVTGVTCHDDTLGFS